MQRLSQQQFLKFISFHLNLIKINHVANLLQKISTSRKIDNVATPVYKVYDGEFAFSLSTYKLKLLQVLLIAQPNQRIRFSNERYILGIRRGRNSSPWT